MHCGTSTQGQSSVFGHGVVDISLAE
eukprot:COSAG02_NODE_61835_length_267_cov_0.928571_1_plen_25_part_10